MKRVRDGKTVPYGNRQQVRQAAKHLDKTEDPAMALAFRITANTGLRISDVLHLRYQDNVLFLTNTIKVCESKGFKQDKARARIKALKEIKDMLIKVSDSKLFMAEIILTAVKDIYALVPAAYLAMTDKKIAAFVAKVKPKYREIEVPKQLMMRLKARQKKFKKVDAGYVFAKTTLKGNRAKNMPGTISREYVWRVFSRICDECKFTFNTSCHQLRKSFALFLYHTSGNDSALVVKAVGWADTKILQRYLSITDKQATSAVNKFQRGYV